MMTFKKLFRVLVLGGAALAVPASGTVGIKPSKAVGHAPATPEPEAGKPDGGTSGPRGW